MLFFKKLKDKYNRFKDGGVWIDPQEIARFVAFFVLFFFLFISFAEYCIFCLFMEYKVFVPINDMHNDQRLVLCMLFFISLIATWIFTHFATIFYERLVNRPIDMMIQRIKELCGDKQLDYIISGKASSPFNVENGDSTWLDIVQLYLDVSSNEMYLDELTGCFNRKYYAQFFEKFMATQMFNYPMPNTPITYGTDVYCIYQVDIDFFKAVNDDYGHEVGDQVLRDVGRELRDLVGDTGIVIRNGGEEFVVIISQKFPYDFSVVAENINQMFREKIYAISEEFDEKRPITCSVGFVQYPLYSDKTIDLTLQDHIVLADKALYMSKSVRRDMWHEFVAGNKPKFDEVRTLVMNTDYALKKGYFYYVASELNDYDTHEVDADIVFAEK